MSSTTMKGVSVRILDKSYMVNCPIQAESGLKSAAEYLDNHMRKIQRSGRVVGLDKIAVMAALNITHELYLLKTASMAPLITAPTDRDIHSSQIEKTLESLHNTIDDALNIDEEIALEHALEVEY